MSDIAFKVLVGNGHDDIIFKTIMLKGEKGDRGEAGGAEIDDSTTALTTTWSSSKINSELNALPENFSQLGDVSITAPSDDQAPLYDATAGKWKNKTIDASTLKYNSVKSIKDEIDSKASNLTELDDVSISSPQSNQGLIYNSTTGKWENGSVSVSGNLDDLADVDIDSTSLADGEALKWNATAQKWENGAVSTTSALADLTDVAIGQSIPDMASLVYNATTSKWKDEKLNGKLLPMSTTEPNSMVADRIEALESGRTWELLGSRSLGNQSNPNDGDIEFNDKTLEGKNEILFGVCINNTTNPLRITLIVPMSDFETYGAFQDFTIGTSIRVYYTATKTTNHKITISGITSNTSTIFGVRVFAR